MTTFFRLSTYFLRLSEIQADRSPHPARGQRRAGLFNGRLLQHVKAIKTKYYMKFSKAGKLAFEEATLGLASMDVEGEE